MERLKELVGSVYSCRNCQTPLAKGGDLVSTFFHSSRGKAYLFRTVENVSVGPLEDRQMTTGLHTVADISCNNCKQIVGWKYEVAHEPSQKWKEGMFIVEKAAVDGYDVSFHFRKS